MLPEAESEQVAGFFTEHSAIGFVYFFQGEYTNILTICTLFFILFFGVSMAIPMIFFMIWIRASQARLRFDQQLTLGWSHFLPFTIGYIIFLPPYIYAINLLAQQVPRLVGRVLIWIGQVNRQKKIPSVKVQEKVMGMVKLKKLT